MIEFAIMLPTFVLVLFGLIHFGSSAMAMQNVSRAAAFTSRSAGVQGYGDLPDQVLKQNIGSAFGSTANNSAVTQLQDNESGLDIYTEADIHQEITEATYNPTGTYVYKDGKMVYVVDEDNLSGWGTYILDNGIDSYAKAIADMMNDWMRRSTSSVEYSVHIPLTEIELTKISDSQRSYLIDNPNKRGSHPSGGPSTFQSSFYSDVVVDIFGGSQNLPSVSDDLKDHWKSN